MQGDPSVPEPGPTHRPPWYGPPAVRPHPTPYPAYPAYPPQPPYAPASAGTAGGPWAVLAAVLVGFWVVGVTAGTQGVAWLIDQVLLATGSDLPRWLWPGTGLINALLAGVPAVLVATLPKSTAVRSAGRAWLLACGTLGLFGLLRLIPMPHHEGYLAALAATAALVALLVGRIPGARQPQAEPVSPADPTVTGRPGAAALAGAAAGLALLLPWVWVGALGGVLESLLAATAAAALGWLVATVLNGGFWAAYRADAAGREVSAVRTVLVGGLVAGVVLAPLAAGAGQPGTQLALLLVLPPAGFALAALARSGVAPAATGVRRATPVGLLVGIGAFGPLAFADPEEISLLLATGRDVPFWVLVASVASLVIALLLGTVGLLAGALPRPRIRAAVRSRRLAGALVVVLLLTAVGGYVGLGQPGWHGERLFVVLTEQADLTGVAGAGSGQAARDARVREVHRRLVTTAERSQTGIRRDLDRLRLRYRPYYLINAVEVQGGPAVRQWLSRRDDVDRVLLGQSLRPLPAPLDAATGDQGAPTTPPWNVTMIGADRVRTELGVAGSGIVVGSSDSGVDGAHPALSGGFRGGDDSWYDPWNGTRSPTDHSGHGTHTLATAVGGQEVGVAPGASWVGCVNLDRNLGNPARYLDCLQFMLAPYPVGGDPFTDGRPERAPHVLTNSWGCPPIEGCDANALLPAVTALTSAGIFFVAAAGNTGPSCGSVDDPPAPYPNVLTVGAVDRARRVTDLSSRGPAPGGLAKPDLVAPGAAVLSAMPGGGYDSLDGTSMAAPHLAGVVALMWSANPALVGDLEGTGRILRDTATPVPGPAAGDGAGGRCGAGANLSGAGLVDAYAAVRAAQAAGREG